MSKAKHPANSANQTKGGVNSRKKNLLVQEQLVQPLQ